MAIKNLGRFEGKSAYETWIEAGHTGTELDFLASLIGQPGTDGRSIREIRKTKTEGLVDTYTIYYTDGTTSTYEVTNGGGGSGTSDYSLLTNKPSINGKELNGDKPLSELGIQGKLTAGDGIILNNNTISYDGETIQNKLISGTNIKTINNQSIVGSGDITIQGTQSQWAGVTIDFMGDSITEGYPGGSTVTKKYWEFLGEKLGATVYGYGIGGSTLADGQNPMWSRVLNMNPADLIFVFGGTNDFANYNRALGDQFTISGGTRTLNVNTATFYGGLNKLCLNLIENFPNATYVLLTPIHRKNFGGQKTDLQANGQGLYLDAYVEAIKNVGKWFSIPVIDLYSEASLYPQNEAQKALYFASSSDGLHPNTLGHEVLSDCIYYQLQGIHRKISGTAYSITKNVTNGSASGASSITNTGTTSVTITPSIGYKLPSTITVTGASYTYNNNTGVISLSNATGNVTIAATCIALANYTVTKNVTGGSVTGVDSIYENGSAVITITPNANYYMPDSITVSGASYTYSKVNQTVTISNPTANVIITVTCEHRAPEVYSIINSITGGTASGDNTITEGSTASVTIAPNASWLLPNTVTVVGATYSYDSTTGVISLSNPTGNVAITAACVEIITYNISTSVTYGSYSGDTQITNVGTATVTIIPSSEYYLPDTITVTSASYDYNKTTGVITLSDAIGNVSITVECTKTVPATWYSDSITDEFIGSALDNYATWLTTGPFIGKEIRSGVDSSHYPYPTQGSKINRIRFRAGKGAQTKTPGDGSLITDVNILIGKFNTSSKQITYLESIPITSADNIVNSRNVISELAVTEFTIDANEKPFVYTSDATKFMAYFSDRYNTTIQGLYYNLTPIEVGTPQVSELAASWTGNLGIDYGYYSR